MFSVTKCYVYNVYIIIQMIYTLKCIILVFLRRFVSFVVLNVIKANAFRKTFLFYNYYTD